MNKLIYDSSDPSMFSAHLNPKDFDMDILPYYLPINKEDSTLIFESRFESGNLRRAIQMYI